MPFNPNQRLYYHQQSHSGLNRPVQMYTPSAYNMNNRLNSTPGPRPFVDQYGLGQRLNHNDQVRINASLLPQTPVQLVQSSVNVGYSVSPASLGFLGDQICVTEVVRSTQLLSSASTSANFLGHNNHYDHYGSYWNNLQNPVNHHSASVDQTQYYDYYGQYAQYYSQIPNPSFYQVQNPPNAHVARDINHAAPSPRPNPNVNHEQNNIPYGYTSTGEPIYNPVPLNVRFPDGTSLYPILDDPDIGNDGRTHSLPCKKYGPYTCPRCGGVFTTSQMFASHMGTHYKYETAEQRRRRRLARLGKAATRVIKPSDALPVVPPPFKRQYSAAAGRRETNNAAADLVDRVVSNNVDHPEVGETRAGKEIVANSNPMEGYFV